MEVNMLSNLYSKSKKAHNTVFVNICYIDYMHNAWNDHAKYSTLPSPKLLSPEWAIQFCPLLISHLMVGTEKHVPTELTLAITGSKKRGDEGAPLLLSALMAFSLGTICKMTSSCKKLA
jgi:hypothetical protein